MIPTRATATSATAENRDTDGTSEFAADPSARGANAHAAMTAMARTPDAQSPAAARCTTSTTIGIGDVNAAACPPAATRHEAGRGPGSDHDERRAVAAGDDAEAEGDRRGEQRDEHAGREQLAAPNARRVPDRVERPGQRRGRDREHRRGSCGSDQQQDPRRLGGKCHEPGMDAPEEQRQQGDAEREHQPAERRGSGRDREEAVRGRVRVPVGRPTVVAVSRRSRRHRRPRT